MSGEMPKQHPRVPIVNEAKAELGKAFSDVTRKYELTWGEVLALLADLMSQEAHGIVRYERSQELQ